MKQARRHAWAPVLRCLTATAFVALFVFGAAVPHAFAWRNGTASNSYGTHDWILDQAVRLAGPDASWIDTATALASTDDPDQDGERITHYFLERGLYRGAPQRVSDLYCAAVTALDAGDRFEASRLLGLLSHYYSDPLNPFHSAYAASSKSSHHAPYEAAVLTGTKHPGMNADWITPGARQPITDVRVKLMAAARFSRTRFPRLIKAIESTKVIDVTRSTVHTVPVEVLSRAANDLADIIGGIARHEGLSQAPAVVKLTLSKRYPAQHDDVTASAKCTDAAGRPMEAIGVRFTWPLWSGRTASVVRYSGADGIARSVRDIGTLPWFALAAVRAKSTVSGTSVIATAAMTPRVSLHSGRAGLRATASSARPKRGSSVSVRAYIHSPSGHHLAHVAVIFTWHYRDDTVVGVRFTDAHGVARMRDDIGSAARGRRIRVTAKVVCVGGSRYTAASFVPR